MRFLPNIGYGTERYPEKIARSLRATNIVAWTVAAISTFFAILTWIEPEPDRIAHGTASTLFAVGFACIPMLHRFGPLIGPRVLVVAGYVVIFRAVMLYGTASGSYLYFLSAAALGVLLTGPRRIWVTAAFAALGAVLIVAAHVLAPVHTGLMPPDMQFYGFFVPNVIVNTALVFYVVFYAFRQMTLAEAVAEREHQRSENLLANILPPRVASRLKDAPDTVIADAYPEASVLFADMAGFTARASDTAPGDLVRFLNGVFTQLDGLVERHGLEKIKTTGDAYMVVSGVPLARADHAAALADLALEIRDSLAGLADAKGRAVPVRIGIASGPVVAGVVGTRKFFYDVWGDAVNIASRMESTGVSGKIQVSGETYERLKHDFVLEGRGGIEVKGKGEMQTWFLLARRLPAGQSS